MVNGFKNLKRKTILIGGLVLILFGLGFLIKDYSKNYSKSENYLKPETALNFVSFNKTENKLSQKEECPIRKEERIVRGDSLSPLIKAGDTVQVLFDYYKCNDVKRDDIVLYSYAGNKEPLIKIIKGMPGDKFKLQQAEGGWHILINGEILRNSEGIPYLISGKRYEMLSLYEKDYKGEIPAGAYLLLGNIFSGTLDSTRFGLISKRDILGKIEK